MPATGYAERCALFARKRAPTVHAGLRLVRSCTHHHRNPSIAIPARVGTRFINLFNGSPPSRGRRCSPLPEEGAKTQKRLKNVEIDARKMADKLRDIKRTLAVEDQPPVEQAIRRLEEIRTALLKEMFAKKEKK